MVTTDLRSYSASQENKKKKYQTDTPELVKATVNVTAADASTVNAELESFGAKKGRKGS